MKSRGQYMVYNSIATFVQQIISVICGLIIPQLMIGAYGSEVYGTVGSITQFISITSLFQGGIYISARVAFYYSVGRGDMQKTSVVYKASNKFFRKFAALLTVYIAVLAILYPLLIKTPLSFSDTALLVVLLGFSSVLEYLFGATNQLLLFADQKAYINTILQIVCIIISSASSIFLIRMNCSVLVVKFAAMLAYFIRPILLSIIVHRLYKIDKSVLEDDSVLEQSNEAITKSIAFYVHTSTDTFVLTICMSNVWVAIYQVHKNVVGSISTLVSSVLGNTEAVFGQMMARDEEDAIDNEVPVYDLLSKILSSIFFFTCIILITQFVDFYTANAKDGVSYHYPVFALIYCASEMIYCMSLTYNNMIMAAGHIKQTQWISIMEAVLNIVLSLGLVHVLGITGVAIGTLVAFAFNSVANIIYMRKNIYAMSLRFIMMSYVVNIFTGIIAVAMFWVFFRYTFSTYIEFFAYAFLVFIVVSFMICAANLIFFRKYFLKVIIKIKEKVLKR